LRQSYCVTALLAAVLFTAMGDHAFPQDNTGPPCEVIRFLFPAQSAERIHPESGNTGQDVFDIKSYLAGSFTPFSQARANEVFGTTEAERNDLAIRAGSHDYSIKCDWMTLSSSKPDYPFIVVTNPVFSSDGELAIVAYSNIVGGTGSRGSLCVVRKRGYTWESGCIDTWIS
jgi:hypothetical protein